MYHGHPGCVYGTSAFPAGSSKANVPWTPLGGHRSICSMSVFREGASNAAAGAHAVVLVAKEVLLAAWVRAPFVVAPGSGAGAST